MTVIARRVASTPSRTPTSTWLAICDLVAAPGSAERRELQTIAGVAAMLIAEEHTAADPIILSGTGPQVRIYTLHGDDAITADPAGETPLQTKITGREWALSLPATGDDLVAARAALASVSPRITVRDPAQEAVKTTPSEASPLAADIDLEELTRP